MDLRKFIDEVPTEAEALELFNLKGSKLMELFTVANEVREKYCGNKLNITTLTNAKAGECLEDCKFCAQSIHYATNIDTYTLKDKAKIVEEFDRAIKVNGADTFCLVTATRGLVKDDSDYSRIVDIAKELKQRNHNIKLCASMGMTDKVTAKGLKEAGIDIYNSNLQTAPSAYDKRVATTHTSQDRLNTLRAAKEAGLEICTGGIVGLGETYEEQVEMAYTLKSLGANVVPINILTPIKGTPYEEQQVKEMYDILKTIAIFRIILKSSLIKIAAGREKRLKDFMGMAFMCGANSMIVSGYLTTCGRAIEDDLKFVDDIKKLWGASESDVKFEEI